MTKGGQLIFLYLNSEFILRIITPLKTVIKNPKVYEFKEGLRKAMMGFLGIPVHKKVRHLKIYCTGVI